MTIVIDILYLAFLLVTFPYYAFVLLRKRDLLRVLWERLGNLAPRRGDRPCLWIHGVSVGEVLAARTLVAEMRATWPEWEVVVSTATPTGHKVAEQTYRDVRIFYFPLDFSYAVRRVLRAIRPSAIVLVEQEMWPNLLILADAARIPVAIVNGRITERAMRRYMIVRKVMERFARNVAFCCSQPEYAERFLSLGVPPDRVAITGNMKYDAVVIPEDVAEARAHLRSLLGIADGDWLVLGGSTHAPEEEILVRAWESLRGAVPRARLLLAPRHPERCHDVARAIEARGHRVVLRSRIGAPPPDGVLLLDTIGELRRMYAAADAVFVGGSLLPHGGQNVIEPAALGRPVLFGWSMHNFQEVANLLVSEKGAVQVRDERELASALERLARDSAEAAAMAARGREVILRQRGATARNVEIIGRLLARAPRPPGNRLTPLARTS